MKIEHYNSKFLCIEYRQDREDPDYGSCMWAEFYFNLERFELVIISDCGNYSHRWPATKSESFLELMARVSKGYLIQKLYGNPDQFDYDSTKAHLRELYNDDEDLLEELERILESVDYYYPETGSDFIRLFDKENDNNFSDVFEFPVYVYPADIKKIVNIFGSYVQPKIEEILEENKDGSTSSLHKDA